MARPRRGFINYPQHLRELSELRKLAAWLRFSEMLGCATLPDSREICMQVKKQQLEPEMEQLPGSKLGKEYELYVVKIGRASCRERV